MLRQVGLGPLFGIDAGLQLLLAVPRDQRGRLAGADIIELGDRVARQGGERTEPDAGEEGGDPYDGGGVQKETFLFSPGLGGVPVSSAFA